MHADGSYVQRKPKPKSRPDAPENRGTQSTLMALALHSKGFEES